MEEKATDRKVGGNEPSKKDTGKRTCSLAVKTPAGFSLYLKVDPLQTTIGSVKNQIQSKWGVPPEYQSLSYKERLLVDDSLPLVSYNIQYSLWCYHLDLTFPGAQGVTALTNTLDSAPPERPTWFCMDKPCLSERETASLMVDLLSCVQYYYHNNTSQLGEPLKPETILFEENEEKNVEVLNLFQYDLGTHHSKAKECLNTFVSRSASYFRCPEEVRQIETYSQEKRDVWACGVMCFILLGGSAPFNGDSDKEIESAITDDGLDFWDDADFVWNFVSEDARDFVEECLDPERNRPIAAEALTHPWLLAMVPKDSFPVVLKVEKFDRFPSFDLNRFNFTG